MDKVAPKPASSDANGLPTAWSHKLKCSIQVSDSSEKGETTIKHRCFWSDTNSNQSSVFFLVAPWLFRHNKPRNGWKIVYHCNTHITNTATLLPCGLRSLFQKRLCICTTLGGQFCEPCLGPVDTTGKAHDVAHCEVSFWGIGLIDKSACQQNRAFCSTNGGFHKWGTPKWMVYNRNSHWNAWRVPLFQETVKSKCDKFITSRRRSFVSIFAMVSVGTVHGSQTWPVVLACWFAAPLLQAMRSLSKC